MSSCQACSATPFAEGFAQHPGWGSTNACIYSAQGELMCPKTGHRAASAQSGLENFQAGKVAAEAAKDMKKGFSQTFTFGGMRRGSA